VNGSSDCRILGFHIGGYEEFYLLAFFVTCFHAGFLFGLFFDPEDGGAMLL
jgi:hypothetical protein